MKKTLGVLGTILALLAILYIVGPILAAYFDVGDRHGPSIYSQDYHEALYKPAYERFHGVTPRVPITTVFYDRPAFYGFDRTLKPERWRREFLKREKESPLSDLLKDLEKTLQGD